MADTIDISVAEPFHTFRVRVQDGEVFIIGGPIPPKGIYLVSKSDASKARTIPNGSRRQFFNTVAEEFHRVWEEEEEQARIHIQSNLDGVFYGRKEANISVKGTSILLWGHNQNPIHLDSEAHNKEDPIDKQISDLLTHLHSLSLGEDV